MKRLTVVAALLLLPSAAAAHHSLAGYDSAHPLTLSGEVAEFSFSQPHPYLVLRVRPPSGLVQLWKAEMDNLFELQDVGMSRDTFRPGDRVTVTGGPDREGRHALYVRRLDRPKDGLQYEQVGTRPRLSPPTR